MAAATKVGENVSYTVNGTKLVITVDLAHRGALSASGKTVRVASTGGNAELAGTAGEDGQNVRLGLNAYVYPER
jgi:hypothetical protein